MKIFLDAGQAWSKALCQTQCRQNALNPAVLSPGGTERQPGKNIHYTLL